MFVFTVKFEKSEFVVKTAYEEVVAGVTEAVDLHIAIRVEFAEAEVAAAVVVHLVVGNEMNKDHTH